MRSSYVSSIACSIIGALPGMGTRSSRSSHVSVLVRQCAITIDLLHRRSIEFW
jgi:hypothetical protein